MQLSPYDPLDQSGRGNLTQNGSSHAAGSGDRQRLPRWRRNLRWWLVAGIVVLLLVLLPPLINANRYQRQIVRSMSLSLGRPVHLDNVSFHLLPVPGLTLSNLVVSEDPAFGAEPTIRANTVEASLRLSSLWRRRVEFSTVRFLEPSVNLVRNRAGRWNLADVLLHASHVNTAPTAQRRAGPAPRFPYIEATGGRVNVKLGEEKLPFSLTAADFALWQPSPHTWRVRLRGQPDRTDVNMTDPGSLRIEGDLRQGTVAEDVRVDLHAHWYDAPLGEATLLVTGSDLGWRGQVNLDASLAGTLEAAQVGSKLTLGGLRRAEFAPTHPLDLQLTCSAGLSIENVLLKQLVCTLPDSAPEPLRLTSPELSLQHPEQTRAVLAANAIPDHWALLWAALFSSRITPGTETPGTFDLQFARSPDLTAPASLAPGTNGKLRVGTLMKTLTKTTDATLAKTSAGAFPAATGPLPPRSAWNGSLTAHFPSPAAGLTGSAAVTPTTLVFRSAWNEPSPVGNPDVRVLFRMVPTLIHPNPESTLQVDGSLSTVGYSFEVSGTADRAALTAPTRVLPELRDDLEGFLPPAGEEQGNTGAGKVAFSCNAAWGTAQVCAASPGSAKGRGGDGPTGFGLGLGSGPRPGGPTQPR